MFLVQHITTNCIETPFESLRRKLNNCSQTEKKKKKGKKSPVGDELSETDVLRLSGVCCEEQSSVRFD